MSENQQIKDLKYFRNQIDQIDLKILDLLEQRMKIIDNVAELKKSNNEKFYIRSAREADMIKNLVNRSQNFFPKSVIMNIWRKIISTANIREQSIKIGIHNPNNIPDYSYIVKNYYNDDVPIVNFDSATSLIAGLENNSCQIGVFALPADINLNKNLKEKINENWWITLANNRSKIKVFAKIPFIEYDHQDKNYNPIILVAVAITEVEKSCEDKTLLSIETSNQIDGHHLLNSLKENGFESTILKSVQINQFEGINFHLVEIDGFLDIDSTILEKIIKSNTKPFVKILGYYAKQILI